MSRLCLRFIPSLVSLCSVPLIILTGCGASTSFSGPTASSKISGKVIGGQQPVAGSLVTIWAAGLTGYGSASTGYLAQTTTGSDGTFSFGDAAYTCPAATNGIEAQVYIIAQGGSSKTGFTNPNIALATGLGNCSTAQTAVVEINEVTTAATAFALAQFFTTTLGSSSADSFGTNTADLNSFALSNGATIPLLVNIANGTVNPNTAGSSTVPAITIEAAKIYSIANTLAACVNDASAFTNCGTLFSNTTSAGVTAPTDTLQAAVQMALNPWQNVSTLYQLGAANGPFVAYSLSTAPNDWTIGVSYTTSSLGLGITGTASSATSASIDIDALGNIWLPTNLPGSTGLAYFAPAFTTFNGPFLTSNFTHPQYVAIDALGAAWLTDQASNTIGYVDTGSVDGNPPGSYPSSFSLGTGFVTLGPVAADDYGDVLFSYIDSSSNPNLGLTGVGATSASPEGQFAYPPTGLVATAGPTADYVVASTSGSGTPCALELFVAGDTASELLADTSSNCTSGGVVLGQYADVALSSATSLNQFCEDIYGLCQTPTAAIVPFTNLPEGIATDGFGDEWIAMSGNGSVLVIGESPDNGVSLDAAYLHDSSNGNTATTPYAIAIDGSGNIWLANASCVTNSATACTPTSFTLSEIIGAAIPTITPLSAQMADDGYLIGSPPGSPPPTSGVGAHPSPFWKSAPKAHSVKPFSAPSGPLGKGLIFLLSPQ